jgi:DnaJ homolog subfamily C member 17
MSDEQKATNDLVALAKDFSSQDVDLYDLLGIPPTGDPKAIQTGFRKQSLLKHPDKAGERYDPVAWGRIQQAKDVLLAPAARAAYDAARGAAQLRRREREQLVGARRRFADDLERRERDARRKRDEQEGRARELERARAQMREDGLRRQDEEERRRAERQEEEEQQQGAPSLEEREADLVRRLEVKARRREERAQRKRERAEREGGETRVSGYYFSTDPKLGYEEKVAGVMAKLRARQREREERQRTADVAMADA